MFFTETQVFLISVTKTTTVFKDFSNNSIEIMDGRKHSAPYRPDSRGAPVSDGRGGGGVGGGGGGGGQRYMAGGRNGVRGDRRPKERDGRDQRMRGGRGRV